MKIKAQIYKVDEFNYKNIRAIVDLTLEDCFVIKGIKLIEGKNGLFMSMPNQKNKNGEYKDICFPITAEFRQQIIDEIMKKYNEANNETQIEKDTDLPF